MGAIETLMIDGANAQVGKHLGLPTHAYMGMSDAKVVDVQSGLESGIGAVLGALAGVNMISGPGMLDFESCFSLEKLVVDAEIVAMAKRLARGIQEDAGEVGGTLAVELIRQVGHAGGFLKTRHTREWFRREQFIPSPVIDRDVRQTWLDKGATTCADRARQRVEQLIAAYQPKPLAPEVIRALEEITLRAARAAGMEALPPLG